MILRKLSYHLERAPRRKDTRRSKRLRTKHSSPDLSRPLAVEQLEDRTLLAVLGPDSFGYVADDAAPFSYEDISSTGTALGLDDDDNAMVSLGFGFDFYGTTYTDVFVGSNGFLTFVSGNDSFDNQDLTLPASMEITEPVLSPLWDDWDPGVIVVSDDVYAETLGTPGIDLRFVAQWHDIVHNDFPAGGTVDFEVVLFETGEFEFLYNRVDGIDASVNNGASATVGIRNANPPAPDNGEVLQVSFDTADISNSQAIHFQPTNVVIDANDGVGATDDGTPDRFIVRRNAADPTLVEVEINGSVARTWSLALLDSITVMGSSDDDTLTVDSSNGLLDFGELPDVRFLAREGFDSLSFIGAEADTETLAVGATPGSGRSTIADGDVFQVVEFQDIEPYDTDVATGTFEITSVAPELASLLQADNAINYTSFSLNLVFVILNFGVVTVDNFEPIEFRNKTNLIIDAGAGDDVVNLNGPIVPDGLTTITVNAGDPTGSDTLIVNGLPAVDEELFVVPTGTGSGTVESRDVDFTNPPTATPGFVPVIFTETEHLTVVGQRVGADGDALAVGSTPHRDFVEFAPGATQDAGTITGYAEALFPDVPFPYTPIEYRGIFNRVTAIAAVTATVAPPIHPASAGPDSLTIKGTSADDTFEWNSEFLFVQLDVLTVRQADIFFDPTLTTGVVLSGLEGNDTFTTDFDPLGAAGLDINIIVQGGDSDQFSDQLTHIAPPNTATTINLLNNLIENTTANDVFYSGVEDVLQISSGATSTLTVVGTFAEDTIRYTPGGPPASPTGGSFTASTTGALIKQHPDFTFGGVEGAFTIEGGGGFDDLEVLGTNGDNVVTSTADSITIDGNKAVTIGADIERLLLSTLDGEDNVDFNVTLAIRKIIEAGLGNDIVDASGATGDPDIYGSDGDDTLTGGPLADNIYGGRGNDILIGAGGADTLYGEEGDDQFGDPLARDPAMNDPGDDRFFGGDGSDVFFWDPGDGNDTIEGGADEADILRFFGSAAAETFNIFAQLADPSRAILFRSAGSITINMAGVDEIDVNGQGGADRFVIGRANDGDSGDDPAPTSPYTDPTATLSDLSTTEVRVVNVDVGVADLAMDLVFVDGRPLDDNILISLESVEPCSLRVAGLPYDVRIDNPALADLDRLTVRGNEGNDTIKSVNPTGGGVLSVESAIGITLAGGAGDDNLSADAILIGGIGDDFLEGGAGDDQFFGNQGEDTMIGGAGADTFDGGPDFDTILIEGTSGNDTIDVFQSAAATLVYTVNGVTETDTLVLVAGVRTVEEARVEAGAGADLVRVRTLDALGADGSLNSLRMTVHGGTEVAAGDRLVVVDDGLDDLVLYRKSQDDSAGTVVIAPGITEPFDNVFEQIEYVQFVDEAGMPLNAEPGNAARLVVFKHDPFEFNNDRFVATLIGANQTVNVDPTIDPGGLTNPFGDAQNVPGDEDWYRVEAEVTGTLDFQVFFEEIGTLDSGRPGLPEDGNLDIELYDADGDLIAGNGPDFGGNDGTGANPELDVDGDAFAENERIRIPAVQGQIYYLRVFGFSDDTISAINNYTITAINLPPPTPFDLELADFIATGTVDFAASTTMFTASGLVLLNDAVTSEFVGKVVVFTSGALVGQQATITAYADATGVITVGTPFSAIPAPGDAFQIESDDTGRSQFDNTTRDNTPTIILRLDDAFFLHDLPGNPTDDTPPDEVIPIPFLGTDFAPGYRIAIFDEGATEPASGDTLVQVPVGFATPLEEGLYTFTFPDDLMDGSHFITARVQMIDPADPLQTGFGPRSVSLEIVVDTVPPPVFFGLPGDLDDGLQPESDTGIDFNQPTLVDLITSVTTPSFFGTAEADSIIRLFVDAPEPGFPTGDGVFEPAVDFQIAFDVAEPFDGTNQYPNGHWEATSNVNLNAAPFSPLDGLRRIFVTAEDVAGNINPEVGEIILEIFIDTQGPQVTDVEINNVGNPYDLFDPKPSTNGPTPLVDSLVISFQDLPARIAEFLFVALKPEIASTPGIYQVKGDHNGIIAIDEIIVTNNPPVAGSPATATVELVFFTPLPDDRFTLTILDELRDLAGNRLDGESNASEPQEEPTFASGDGVPGGNFVARFTVDSRPEIGVWSGGSVYVDTNGNNVWDPEGKDNDDTNEDITYVLGFTTDNVFAGNFAEDLGATADGFDKLAAYGRVGGTFRFLFDTDNDGVPDEMTMPGNVNGLPVAGNFDGNAANGDEVAVFTGTTWHLDTNHDFVFNTVVTSQLRGLPFAGDFNGDGDDDLGTYNESQNRFEIDLSSGGTFSGTIDVTIEFDFPGVRENPVAADMDQDGFDDLGLFVPDRGGQTLRESGEWYFLVSGGESLLERIQTDPDTGKPTILFEPEPFGHDILAQFGDEFAIPVVGNFDPPVAAASAEAALLLLYQNPHNPLDVNGDNSLSPVDALQVINDLNDHGSRLLSTQWTGGPGSFIDVNGDRFVSAIDALMVINELNERSVANAAAAGIRTASMAPSAADVLLGSPYGEQETSSVPVSLATNDGVATSSEETDATYASAALASTHDILAGEATDSRLSRPNSLSSPLPSSLSNDDLDGLIADIAEDVAEAWEDGEAEDIS